MTARSDAAAPRLLRGRLLRGGNVHHGATVFVQPFVPGLLAGKGSQDAGPDFAMRFAERFGGVGPAGAARSALVGQPRFSLVEALLEAILAVERQVARTMGRLEEPRFSRILLHEDRVDLVWESWSAGTSRAAALAAFTGIMELLPASVAGVRRPARDYATLMKRLRRRALRRQWSPTAAVLAMVARQRGLFHEVLAGSYVRIGEGVMQQVVSDASLGIARRPQREGGVAQRADVPADEKLHRFLVVNGALVSSLRCDPPRILGDGASTVGELIRRLNDDPRRSGLALRSIPVDAQLQARLGELGVDLDDVLPRGRHLILTGARTPERGAMPIDVTEGVHESVRDAVLRAAAGERGPIVGVDFLTADVRLSCQQGGGRVSGTTSAPELHPHALPEHGRVREFGDALLAVVIPGGATPTIPTAMLVGERRMRDVARGLDRFLRAAHEGVGSATRDGATIQGRPLERTARGQRSGPEFLLGDPRLTMLVSTISPRRIVERGLGLDRVRVVGLLDPASTPASDAYRACIGVCLAALPDVFVIGAGNAHLPQVLDALGPSRVLLVARRRDDPVAASHLAAGGAAVVPSDDGKSAELLRGADTIGSIPLGSLRASKAGRPGRRRSGGLHAAAMAWALGHGTGPAAGDPATAPGPAVADAPPVRTPAGGD